MRICTSNYGVYEADALDRVICDLGFRYHLTGTNKQYYIRYRGRECDFVHYAESIVDQAVRLGYADFRSPLWSDPTEIE